jgi:hypothetical protein
MVGNPVQPLPDLVILSVASLIPLLIATGVTRIPGAAAAVCGAYLLPRSLLSLLAPEIAPPPPLLVPAIAFDVALWMRLADLAGAIGAVWPWGRAERRWRKKRRVNRTLDPPHAAVAGAVFGVVMCAVVPPWTELLGGDAAAWPRDQLVLAAAVAAVGSAAAGVLATTVLARR